MKLLKRGFFCCFGAIFLLSVFALVGCNLFHTEHTWEGSKCSVCGKNYEKWLEEEGFYQGDEYYKFELLKDETYAIVGYQENIPEKVVLPSSYRGKPVTSIGNWPFTVNGAFQSCKSLTSVVIPDSMTIIGSDAFYDCTGLTSVTISDSVTSIGVCAFGNCIGLTSVTVGNSVTSIGGSAFSGCTDLTSVIIPDSVTSIWDEVFYECHRLTSVTIGSGVTKIEPSMFFRCFNLTSVTIPDSVTSIGDDAFCLCTGLTGITIPDSVTSIGEEAFAYCDRLKDVYYRGTEAQWKAIEIGSWNAPLTTNATVHYNYKG